MIHRRAALLGVAFSPLAPMLVNAHGFHAAFAVIEFNPRSQSLEIIHRIFIQDIELALTEKAKGPITLDQTPATEKLIWSYLDRAFSLATPDGRALKPAWVGLKLRVDTMFVYQELKDAGALTALMITDRILTETHPAQVNTVNISLKGRTQTLIFTASDDAQTVTF